MATRKKKIFCQECNAENPSDQNYCGRCGADLQGKIIDEKPIIDIPSVPVSFSFWLTTLLVIGAVIYLVSPFDLVPFTVFDDMAFLGIVGVLWLWVAFLKPIRKTRKKVVKT